MSIEFYAYFANILQKKALQANIFLYNTINIIIYWNGGFAKEPGLPC